MPSAIRPIRGPEDFAAAFTVSRETLERLATYATLLRQWQKAVNLVGPATLDAVWHRHFADSAQLLDLAPSVRTWVDLGSGAGFPALVIAILLADPARRPPSEEATPIPDPSPQGGGGAPGQGSRQAVCFTLIDSNARKCAFLADVVRETGLGNLSSWGVAVHILSTRIETAATQASLQQSQIVSARALAPLDRLLELAAPLFAPQTTALFLKGREAAQEVETARRTWEFRARLVDSRTEAEGRIVVLSGLGRRGSPERASNHPEPDNDTKNGGMTP